MEYRAIRRKKIKCSSKSSYINNHTDLVNKNKNQPYAAFRRHISTSKTNTGSKGSRGDTPSKRQPEESRGGQTYISKIDFNTQK